MKNDLIFRRGIGIAALSLSICATLVGCGGDDNNDNDIIGVRPTPTPTARPTPTPSPSPSPVVSPSPSPSPTPTPTPTPTPDPFTTTASGLRFRDAVVGTGAEATAGKTATVTYRGTFTDGRQFDAGSFPFVINGGSVIPGFNEGVRGMKVGGKRFLEIPANLAYGASGSGSIPPNTPINFEIDLTKVE